jgi:16S rRNA (cytosine1402-N4)-methyltransferase
LAEVLERLQPQPGQIFVDGTLGFAGHSAALLERIGPTGHLHAFDLDGENLPRAEQRLAPIGHPFTLHRGNFAGLQSVLYAAGVEKVHGLLADLGMSSMQVDDRERGFSFLRDGPLDMRMDRSRGRTAADLLNTLSQEELEQAFTELGDEPMAGIIAQAIVERRTIQPWSRTAELRDCIEQVAPVDVHCGPGMPAARKQRLGPATRVFQAIRILVNRELANLTQLLRVLPEVLAPGGCAAIISFHSGEDRLIKAAFRDGVRAGVYSESSDEPIRPSEAERTANPRSRSAKLRWAKRAAN